MLVVHSTVCCCLEDIIGCTKARACLDNAVTADRRLGLAERDLPSAGDPDRHLVCVLAKHAGKLQWVASIFQPSITQAATLLPILLETHGQDTPAQADAGSSHATTEAQHCSIACWGCALSAQACQQRAS